MAKKVCQTDKCTTRTASIPGDLQRRIARRTKGLDMGFSRYIQALVKLDLERKLL